MRLGNVAGRPHIVTADGEVDVAVVSAGRFGADMLSLLDQWDEFRDWAAAAEPAAEPSSPGRRGSRGGWSAPVPMPRQVFAIGMNYRKHADETGLGTPGSPSAFTKFPTCITGPAAEVTLPPGDVDWEVELVAVIGRAARCVTAGDAWDYVAGLCVGQDLSERRQQLAPPSPQFSLGKSHPGFGPTGPFLVTVDEIDNPDDLELRCSLNGEEVQKGRTRDMIFPVPELISRLSAVVTLLPGDLIFTGTPDGVGFGRKPRRFLSPGDVLVSSIEQIGGITTRFAVPPEAKP
jgi:2-keto-4-pentenoate hydratase/2-oxohepta-3-ene-1,7-dioic acid hydratase in catechol pathway